jgi:plastocyanin
MFEHVLALRGEFVMRTRVLIGVMAVVTLSVAGCAGGPDGTTPEPTTAQQTPTPSTPATPSAGSEIKVGALTASYHGTVDVGGLQDVNLKMANNFFEPTVVRGKPGQQLTLHLENNGEDSHTFTTADGKADIEVKPRSVAEGKITLPESGNLEFFCRFSKDRGMAGVFNVSGSIDSPGPAAASPQKT